MNKEILTHSEDIVSAVFLAENIQNPEYFINTISFQLIDKYPKLTNGFFLLTYEIEEPSSSKKQGLKVSYQFSINTHNRLFEVISISIEPIESLIITFPSDKNNKETFKSENGQLIPITSNKDNDFFKFTEKSHFNKGKQKVCFKPNEIFIFEPVYIPKPWGQEIWFTGVEKRGVSKVKFYNNSKVSLPLTWVFSALPSKLLGSAHAHKNLILVKILDPLPDEVFGDLYYELHTEKNEVYVVTEVSAETGKIKYGANPEKLKEFSNNIDEYKKQFLIVIKQYEEIRREIDGIFDTYRLENNISMNDPIPANKIKEWSKNLPTDLLNNEKKKRAEMDSFAGYLDLKIGDVVRVPILVPHALQHGVKVIEFQTPTYERFILSFAQKVLTQDHWDTDEAFEKMKILPPQKTELETLDKNENFCEELVCSFNEFKSSRFSVKENQKITVAAQDLYRILFNVTGTLRVNSDLNDYIEILPGACILLPAGVSYQLYAKSDVTFLFCLPK